MNTNWHLFKRGIIICIIPFALIVATLGIQLAKHIPNAIILTIVAITYLVLISIIALIHIVQNKGLYNTRIKLQILHKLQDSLYSVGAYTRIDDTFVKTPQIKVDLTNRRVSIDLSNIYIRSKVESYFDILSTALPSNLTVDRAWIDKTQSKLLIDYQDLSKDTRIVYKSKEDFIEHINIKPLTELQLDRFNHFELKDLNGVLIVGSSGSGKTYLLQQLIMQGLIKGWDISIIDYKRTYQLFQDVCDVSFKIDDIISCLEKALDELHHRQEVMEVYLKRNPNILAIDCGFKVRVLVIEEYLALVNSGIDKKTLDRIEKMLLELITTGRQMNISLIMCMQVSSSQTLNTSIRANLPVKICMGNANRTILETLFGVGNAPKIPTKLDKGEGLATYDFDIFPIKVPTLDFDSFELIDFINQKRNNSPSL